MDLTPTAQEGKECVLLIVSVLFNFQPGQVYAHLSGHRPTAEKKTSSNGGCEDTCNIQCQNCIQFLALASDSIFLPMQTPGVTRDGSAIGDLCLPHGLSSLSSWLWG